MSELVSEWVTRSPIELLWTAKNNQLPKPDLKDISNLTKQPDGFVQLCCVARELGSLGQLQKETTTLAVKHYDYNKCDYSLSQKETTTLVWQWNIMIMWLSLTMLRPPPWLNIIIMWLSLTKLRPPPWFGSETLWLSGHCWQNWDHHPGVAVEHLNIIWLSDYLWQWWDQHPVVGYNHKWNCHNSEK